MNGLVPYNIIMLFNKHQVLNACVTSIQKYKSNMSEKYDAFMKSDSKSYLIKMRPDLFDDHANNQLLAWSKDLNPSNDTLICAIEYVKKTGAGIELQNKLINDDIPDDLLHDPRAFLDNSEWMLPIAPDIIEPVHIIPSPELPVVKQLQRILDIIKDETRYNNGTGLAVDRNNNKVDIFSSDAVKWNFNGAMYKIIDSLSHDDRWISSWIERSLMWAVNKVKPPYWNYFWFTIHATKNMRIEQVRWAIYLYTYHRWW